MDKFSQVPYSFDQDYLKRVKRADFIKAHEHLSEVIDLGGVWDSAHGKLKPEAAE